MYFKKVIKEDLTFRIKNAIINFKPGDVVFVEIDRTSMIAKIHQGNVTLDYHIKKARNFFVDEQEEALVDDVIDEIANHVVRKIEADREKRLDDLYYINELF